MPRFLTRCCSCRRSTSKKYANEHCGQCKSCVTGIPRESRYSSSLDAQHERNGNEETFGMSREGYESYLSRGSYCGD